MNKLVKLMVAGSGLVLSGCCCCNPCGDPVVGNWGARLPYDDMYAGSFVISRGADGAAKALVLWRWGSPEWCSEVKLDGDSFFLKRADGLLFRGKVCGDRMFGEVAVFDDKNPNGKLIEEYRRFEGWRNPPIEAACTKDAKLGEPIDLLKDGLAGWRAMGKGNFGWSFKDGVLSNRIKRDAAGKRVGGDVNLISKRADFFDFNLSYDVCVPKGCNSGVYLRGRYEIQTVDSYGQPVDRHNMAAFYGRITPKVAAEKAPGEWQHVDVTLYKRHVTVILNGVTIIDNEPVEGVTGGAIDANEFVPGPLYLQGDHSDADYKNMILRPVVD